MLDCHPCARSKLLTIYPVRTVSCQFTVGGVPVPGGWRGQRFEPSGTPGGMPDLIFTPAATVQPTPALPPLRGDWLFFLQAGGGCAGPPPDIHLQFSVVCGP